MWGPPPTFIRDIITPCSQWLNLNIDPMTVRPTAKELGCIKAMELRTCLKLSKLQFILPVPFVSA